MATTKSPSTTSNSNQISRAKEDVHSLKNKIVDLERQVNEYKSKLDELRRAKATTVVKLEKEYVNTSLPGVNRTDRSKPCEKCDEFEKLLESERKSNQQLKRLIEQKDDNSKQATVGKLATCSKCPESKQLLDIERENNLQLTQQIQNEKKQTEIERNTKEMIERAYEMVQAELIQLKNSVEGLRAENQQYKKSFELMKEEHSEKMADLCQREEEAKKQIATWEQMYREWMATMERRVNNLQVTNEELQTWLGNENENDNKNRNSNKHR